MFGGIMSFVSFFLYLLYHQAVSPTLFSLFYKDIKQIE